MDLDERSKVVFQWAQGLLQPAATGGAHSCTSPFVQRALVDLPDFYLIDRPAGKPLSTAQAPCTSSPDNRPRTLQKAQKGQTCWYYALKNLRRQIGQFHTPEWEAQRRLEQELSQLRKALTAVDALFPEIFLHSERYVEDLEACDYSRACLFLQDWDLQKQFLGSDEDDQRKVRELLGYFVQLKSEGSFKDFLDIIHAHCSSAIEEAFLHRHGMSGQQVYEMTHPGNLSVAWHELDSDSKENTINGAMIYKAASLYGLGRSPWIPSHPIDSLIAQLRSHGPHVVEGSLYFDRLDIVEEIEGRRVYDVDWSSVDGGGGHVITVVGAKKEKDGSGTIYFLDPNQESAPDEPRTLCSMPYEELQRNVCNLLGDPPQYQLPYQIGYAFIARTPDKDLQLRLFEPPLLALATPQGG